MFWENFEKLCRENNKKPTVVVKELEIAAGSVTKWKKGASPSGKNLKKIANYFNVSADYLLSDTQTRASKTKGVKINVLGSVAAGIPISAIHDVIDEEEITEELAAQGDFFGLAIKGDSMSPMIMNGDTVIVKAQPEVNDGDIAIALVGEEEATCKKIKKTPEGVMLIPLNSEYEPIFYTNKQIEQLPVRVIGKVVEQRRKF